MDVNVEIIDRLMKIDYFSNCTKKIVPDIKYGYEFVTKSTVIKSLSGVKWDNLLLEKTGDLTVYLFKNHYELYCNEYNSLIDDIHNHYISLLEEKYDEVLTAFFGDEKELVKCNFTGDITHIIVADTFKDMYEMELYPDLLKVYESGQFPCGWRGKYPHGNMLIY